MDPRGRAGASTSGKGAGNAHRPRCGESDGDRGVSLSLRNIAFRATLRVVQRLRDGPFLDRYDVRGNRVRSVWVGASVHGAFEFVAYRHRQIINEEGITNG